MELRLEYLIHQASSGRGLTTATSTRIETPEGKWREVDGKLLMLTDPGVLILAEGSPAGYKEIGRAPIIDEQCFAAPIYANGCVYARNTGGDVVCVDVR